MFKPNHFIHEAIDEIDKDNSVTVLVCAHYRVMS